MKPRSREKTIACARDRARADDPTIPADYTMNNSPADVHVHPNGRFVYVTFAVDGDSGTLTPTGAKVDVPRPVCVQCAPI